MTTLTIVLLVILTLVALIDWKFKQIPSVFLTGIIFMTLITQFYLFENGLIALSFGVLAFVYGWMLYEADFIGGIADVKFIAIVGLVIINIQAFFIFVLLVVFFGFLFKLIHRFILKKSQKEEIPFIPILLLVYVVLMGVGLVA